MSSSDTADSLYTIQFPNQSVPEAEAPALNFRQRQADVFAALANLEAAHKEVTKATKEERKLIRKTAWKQTLTAPENLAEQKECRDNILKRGICPQDMPNFRRPAIPPNRRPIQQRRDPNKWTHYSLADVDEDGPICRPGANSNASIAVAFINELRERKSEESPQLEDEQNRQNHRILFRPTRGTKKPRLDEVAQSDSTVNSVGLSCNFNDDDDDDYEDNDNGKDESQPADMTQSNEASGTKSILFVNRQRRFRQRDRLDDDKEDPMSVSEASTDEVEDTSESEILLNNLDEMEHDDGDDHSEDHLF